MRTGVTHLFIPGPTNVPERVRRAMNVPMEDHRAPDFPALTMPLSAVTGLKASSGAALTREANPRAGSLRQVRGAPAGRWDDRGPETQGL